MGSEWKKYALGEVLTLQRGFDLPMKERHPGPYPVIASTGQVGVHIEAKAKGPGVVIGRSGSLGGGQYIHTDYWPLNTTLWVKDFKKNDPRFCYYLLKSIDFTKFNAGSGVPTLNRNHIHPLPILIPEKDEQRAIASILGSLDDKIELNRRMNETLEAMARAIFKSWFVDFDPVRAKAESRAPGLPKGIADLFPDSFEGSELGEIPRGWRVVSLGDVADVNWGDTNITKKSYIAEGHIAYSAKGPDGFLPYHDYDRTGVVVSAIGANSGHTWLAQGKWSCIKNTLRFWSTDDDISTEYLYHATIEKPHWPLRGSAQPFISQGDARKIKVIKPNNRLSKRFGEFARTLYEKVLENADESCTLVAIRDSLLPKLISGEIRIKDAEKFVVGIA